MSRQLNVQQQNKIAEDRIRREAFHWRQNPIPNALLVAGQERGIDWARSIIIDLDIDYPGLAPLFGHLLSQDERFIRFEVDSDKTHQVFKGIECWDDVTAKENLSAHNPGIGAGSGALAIKVLHELNALQAEAPASEESQAP